MNISNARKLLSFFLLAGGSYAWAADPAGTKCGDLFNMQIDNATVSEAIDVPAGKPLSVGGAYGPPVLVTSLPAHCLVHGEVNHIGLERPDAGTIFSFSYYSRSEMAGLSCSLDLSLRSSPTKIMRAIPIIPDLCRPFLPPVATK